MLQDQISLAEFVLQEAREKCFEIEVKAFKQFEKEKKQIVEKEKSNIQEEINTKYKKKAQQERIKHSALVNGARMRLMNARNQALTKIFSDSQYQIYKMIRQDERFYEELLKNLMVQGLIKLFEHEVVVRCLQRDIRHVRNVIEDAISEFQDILRKELNGLEFEVKIDIDEDKCLDERALIDNSIKSVQDYSSQESSSEVISKTENDKKCFGGILMTTKDGLIVCKNTLDVRTDQTFQDSLPIIRSTLFGK
ncbi:unnamed protein product (macronuclear) [Paramecium tetraurelia]|uniref:Vacuolar ATP synthase subunit E n=1 Tax=Paramecium tetraurelia TaxID=5888 RepID=A0BMT5_PARTE|nr:uncharacterized protein GSPATT00030488001 [Paramecium tetraurelia]CAK59852.1 unnamed protein product [Paramecium tetraurelia]|eukprot:XP_001427250.1 hypothetical protein (macronuclear) [Paramecium tetraurelia strain d4-2]